MLDLVMLVGGGALLYFGAEWLVGGAAGLARSFAVSTLLVGLTVVAYGTSMPEVVVSVSASWTGHGEIALGNVLGSNVANLGLILGTAALVAPTHVSRALRDREVPVLVGTALLVPLLVLDGRIAQWEGATLVAVAIGYTAWVVRRSLASSEGAVEGAAATAEAAEVAGAPATGAEVGRPRLVLLVVVGLGSLVLGGHLLVEGASGLARAVGISERIVGLTIVAVGTSLPELATSVIAARRGHPEIAVGNVVGSNIFNVLLCLGSAALAGELATAVDWGLAFDVGAMIAFTLFGALLMRTERFITRGEGVALLVLYVAFVAMVVALPG